MQFEYATSEVTEGGQVSLKTIQAHLSRHGVAGWELVAQYRRSRNHIDFIWKRPVIEEIRDNTVYPNYSSKSEWREASADEKLQILERALEQTRDERVGELCRVIPRRMLDWSRPMPADDFPREFSGYTFNEITLARDALVKLRVIEFVIVNSYDQPTPSYRLIIQKNAAVVRYQKLTKTEHVSSPHHFGLVEGEYDAGRNKRVVVYSGRPLSEAPERWRQLAPDAVGYTTSPEGDLIAFVR